MKSLIPFAALRVRVWSPVPAGRRLIWLISTLSVLILASSGAPARGADFTVTYIAGTSTYNINGIANNPTLTLVRGETYTFEINSIDRHPFFVHSAGVSNNNVSSGLITYTVPMDPRFYSYYCSIHFFGGTIVTVPPPDVRITSLSVSNNLVLQSTGATNYSVVPEFNTNLASANWVALTVQTNRFLGGTNETICGKPPDGNVFIRIKSVRN